MQTQLDVLPRTSCPSAPPAPPHTETQIQAPLRFQPAAKKKTSAAVAHKSQIVLAEGRKLKSEARLLRSHGDKDTRQYVRTQVEDLSE